MYSRPRHSSITFVVTDQISDMLCPVKTLISLCVYIVTGLGISSLLECHNDYTIVAPNNSKTGYNLWIPTKFDKSNASDFVINQINVVHFHLRKVLFMKTVSLFTISLRRMSRPMGKPTICIGENKGANQLRGNREADQRLCFRFLDSTIPPLLNFKISSF